MIASWVRFSVIVGAEDVLTASGADSEFNVGSLDHHVDQVWAGDAHVGDPIHTILPRIYPGTLPRIAR